MLLNAHFLIGAQTGVFLYKGDRTVEWLTENISYLDFMMRCLKDYAHLAEMGLLLSAGKGFRDALAAELHVLEAKECKVIATKRRTRYWGSFWNPGH